MLDFIVMQMSRVNREKSYSIEKSELKDRPRAVITIIIIIIGLMRYAFCDVSDWCNANGLICSNNNAVDYEISEQTPAHILPCICSIYYNR